MVRPAVTPTLDPRQPRSLLGWTMREMRHSCGWGVTRTAVAFGCSPSHITRVELGQARPSRDLTEFYEHEFEGEGLLPSMMEVVESHAEQQRRRRAQTGGRISRTMAGDAAQFVERRFPLGSLFVPGERFCEAWRIRNAGTVAWVGRQLERQGPRAGPGLITSERRYAVPDTAPGEIATIQAPLAAPTYDCSTVAYFKLVDAVGRLCFPDDGQGGLDVLILVRGGPDAPVDRRRR
jgi:hypothetical protein